MSDLQALVKQLRDAHAPEDIFGELHGSSDEMLAQAGHIYRRLAKQVHPDSARGDDGLATEGFKRLQALWERAQRKIKQGVYGQTTVTLKTAVREYTIAERIARGDMCNVYRCTYMRDGALQHGTFKVVRSPANNDLIENEAAMLRRLAETGRFAAYFPPLVESIRYRDPDMPAARQANIIGLAPKVRSPLEYYSLAEVKAHYRTGIDARDMAWMWRRVLVALGAAHDAGIVHGAVLPTHILIHPVMHGVVLIDWAYAVSIGQPLQAISIPHEGWYPEEVTRREGASPSLDISMAARCMIDVLGGNGSARALPPTLPRRLHKLFEWCLMDGPRLRPQSAWKLLETFDETIEALWGVRRFREFKMPLRHPPAQ